MIGFMDALVKSKKRIKDHGEVFTPDFIVNAMLELVKHETERIESRFLEPACGDGNFLAPVLQRKLDVVLKKYGRSQTDFEKNALVAVSSIYGIELLQDNVSACQKRLFNIFDQIYTKKFKTKCKDNLRKNIEFILERNILQGDALTLKTNNDTELIVFSNWSLVSDGRVKRSDFQFVDLTQTTDGKKTPSIFLIEEVSDSGETIFSPMPVKEYPLMHYLKFDYEDAK